MPASYLPRKQKFFNEKDDKKLLEEIGIVFELIKYNTTTTNYIKNILGKILNPFKA